MPDVVCYLQVLRRSQGALQLLDVAAQLPSLRRMPGRSHWVVGQGSAHLSSWAQAEAQQVTCQDMMTLPRVKSFRMTGMLCGLMPSHLPAVQRRRGL